MSNIQSKINSELRRPNAGKGSLSNQIADIVSSVDMKIDQQRGSLPVRNIRVTSDISDIPVMLDNGQFTKLAIDNASSESNITISTVPDTAKVMRCLKEGIVIANDDYRLDDIELLDRAFQYKFNLSDTLFSILGINMPGMDQGSGVNIEPLYSFVVNPWTSIRAKSLISNNGSKVDIDGKFVIVPYKVNPFPIALTQFRLVELSDSIIILYSYRDDQWITETDEYIINNLGELKSLYSGHGEFVIGFKVNPEDKYYDLSTSNFISGTVLYSMMFPSRPGKSIISKFGRVTELHSLASNFVALTYTAFLLLDDSGLASRYLKTLYDESLNVIGGYVESELGEDNLVDLAIVLPESLKLPEEYLDKPVSILGGEFDKLEDIYDANNNILLIPSTMLDSILVKSDTFVDNDYDQSTFNYVFATYVTSTNMKVAIDMSMPSDGYLYNWMNYDQLNNLPSTTGLVIESVDAHNLVKVYDQSPN